MGYSYYPESDTFNRNGDVYVNKNTTTPVKSINFYPIYDIKNNLMGVVNIEAVLAVRITDKCQSYICGECSILNVTLESGDIERFGYVTSDQVNQFIEALTESQSTKSLKEES